MAKSYPSADRVRELLNYDQETGIFTWRVNRPRRMAGSIAGCVRYDGYVVISIGNRLYLCHRLAWLYVTGEWPTKFIDHIDRNPTNNKFSNLREATNSENMHNRKGAPSSNTTGHMGVSFCQKRNKYRAYIDIEGIRVFCKRFRTLDEAIAARKDAELLYHKEKPT